MSATRNTAGEPEVLKRGPYRTVRVAADGRVVKRFQHPGRLGALRDGRRARNERRILRHLRAAGVRVPEPLDVRRTAHGVELHMQRVEGARTLEDRWSAGERLDRVELEALGALLAGLHRARVDQPDLHPGNVLFDDRGRAWLIDFHAARVRRTLGPRRVRRDLVALAAHARERTRAPERSRVLRAWCAAAPARLAATLEALGAEPLEALARVHRRERLAAWSGRWLRPSSRVQVERGPGDRLAIRARPPAGFGTEEVGAFQEERRSGALRLALPAGEARARWRIAVRLFEHHLPVPRPLALTIEGADGELVLDPGLAPSSLPAVRPLGALLGQLHDRGLEPASLTTNDLVEGPKGALWRPPGELRPVDPQGLGADRFRCLGSPVDEAWRAAYLAIWRDRPAERRRLRARLAAERAD